MIAIIDYGVGNLFSLKASLKYLGIDSEVTSDAEHVRSADKLILPGVGAFADARAKLDASGLTSVIREEVFSGKYLLGICLGMQMLFDVSYEYGVHAGLGFVPGEVRSLEKDLLNRGISLKVPEMGWNSLKISRKDPILKYNAEGDYVYYVHSYYVPEAEHTLASSEYGVSVSGVVRAGCVYGTQFHPEKSGPVGLKILRAFDELK